MINGIVLKYGHLSKSLNHKLSCVTGVESANSADVTKLRNATVT